MPAGGTVTITTWGDTEAGTICVNLSDTGKGIPADAAERIFQPFFTTKVKGVGLGLAVARRLVEEYGGGITVTDNHPLGATFKIVLPRMPGISKPVD